MKKITAEELEEGMVLARPVVDSLNRALLEKGDVMKDLYIRKLRSWKIDEIYVESDEESGEPDMSTREIEVEVARIDEALGRNFKGIDKRENMKVILTASREFLVQSLREHK